MNTNNPVWQKFDLQNNLIKEYTHWMLLLRKNHVKVGSCVAILKRDAFPLSEVRPEEMAEYALIAQEIETALKKTFNPHLVQHLMLMFVDKHIHFHILPRYTEPVDFGGVIWEDDNAADPLIQRREDLSQNILNQIKETLASHLGTPGEQ